MIQLQFSNESNYVQQIACAFLVLLSEHVEAWYRRILVTMFVIFVHGTPVYVYDNAASRY